MGFGTNTGQDITFNVGAVALTQFTFVKMGAAGVVVCTGADGEEPVGVCQDNAALGTSSQVRTYGPSKVLCGASFAIGDKLMSDSTGRAIKYVTPTVVAGTPAVITGPPCLGIAVEAGAVNNIVAMLYSPRGLTA